jgi:hypothetical protein
MDLETSEDVLSLPFGDDLNVDNTTARTKA